MRCCLFAFVCLLVCVQGGPYKGKPRPIPEPPVVVAQWYLHDEFLAIEEHVLQLSLEVSKLAGVTTQEAYRLTDEAEDRLMFLERVLREEIQRIRALAPECVNNWEIWKTQQYFSAMGEKLYKCTHALSNAGASLEVEMTLKLIEARSQIWDVQQAMWFCQQHRPEVDKECLKRFVVEGLQVLDKLPERGKIVLNKARATQAESLNKLKGCFIRNLSVAEEKQLTDIRGLTKCLNHEPASENESVTEFSSMEMAMRGGEIPPI